MQVDPAAGSGVVTVCNGGLVLNLGCYDPVPATALAANTGRGEW